MNQQKIPYRSRKNKYIPILCSFILLFSILPPVNAHLLAKNQSPPSQNNTNKTTVQKRRRGPTRDIEYRRPSRTATPIKSATGAITRRSGYCPRSNNSEESSKKITNVTNLAPHSYVGQTISTHPTFSWYVTATESYPLEFVLHKLSPNTKEPIVVYKESMASKQGIMQLSLPKNQSKLIINERYFWYVNLNCSPNRPSKNPIDESQFEVVQISSELSSKLENEKDVMKKAKLYAEEGFWYDVFAYSLQLPQNDYAYNQQKILLRNLAEGEIPKRKDSLLEIINSQFK